MNFWGQSSSRADGSFKYACNKYCRLFAFVYSSWKYITVWQLQYLPKSNIMKENYWYLLLILQLILLGNNYDTTIIYTLLACYWDVTLLILKRKALFLPKRLVKKFLSEISQCTFERLSQITAIYHSFRTVPCIFRLASGNCKLFYVMSKSQSIT